MVVTVLLWEEMAQCFSFLLVENGIGSAILFLSAGTNAQMVSLGANYHHLIQAKVQSWILHNNYYHY